MAVTPNMRSMIWGRGEVRMMGMFQRLWLQMKCTTATSTQMAISPMPSQNMDRHRVS